MSANKVALITGAAQRIGAQLARTLHKNSYNILVHYHQSSEAAEKLVDELNGVRPDSAKALQANLTSTAELLSLTRQCEQWQGRVDVLINNASSYYATPWGNASEEDWDALMGSNLKGAFFIVQALLPALKKQRGCVINIIDIFADKPLRDHPVYCIAKAGLAMMTKSLALDCGSEIRVNGIAPGTILWPAIALSGEEKQQMLNRIPNGDIGEPSDIARTALFLMEHAPYVNGQIIAVDGGLSLT